MLVPAVDTLVEIPRRTSTSRALPTPPSPNAMHPSIYGLQRPPPVYDFSSVHFFPIHLVLPLPQSQIASRPAPPPFGERRKASSNTSNAPIGRPLLPYPRSPKAKNKNEVPVAIPRNSWRMFQGFRPGFARLLVVENPHIPNRNIEALNE